MDKAIRIVSSLREEQFLTLECTEIKQNFMSERTGEVAVFLVVKYIASKI